MAQLITVGWACGSCTSIFHAFYLFIKFDCLTDIWKVSITTGERSGAAASGTSGSVSSVGDSEDDDSDGDHETPHALLHHLRRGSRGQRAQGAAAEASSSSKRLPTTVDGLPVVEFQPRDADQNPSASHQPDNIASSSSNSSGSGGGGRVAAGGADDAEPSSISLQLNEAEIQRQKEVKLAVLAIKRHLRQVISVHQALNAICSLMYAAAGCSLLPALLASFDYTCTALLIRPRHIFPAALSACLYKILRN